MWSGTLFDNTGRGDDDVLLRPSRLAALGLNRLHDGHTLHNLAEDNVFAVQP